MNLVSIGFIWRNNQVFLFLVSLVPGKDHRHPTDGSGGRNAGAYGGIRGELGFSLGFFFFYSLLFIVSFCFTESVSTTLMTEQRHQGGKDGPSQCLKLPI